MTKNPDDEPNPYATPRSKVRDRGLARAEVAEGSYGLGVFLGAILGLWGIIGCALMAKPETKRGSLHGFLGRLGAGGLIVLIVLATS